MSRTRGRALSDLYATDFRFACSDCGQFVAAASVLGSHEDDGYALVGICRRHGVTGIRRTPVRWATDDPDMAAEWDRMIAEEAALGRKVEALSRGYRKAWEQVFRFAAAFAEIDVR